MKDDLKQENIFSNIKILLKQILEQNPIISVFLKVIWVVICIDLFIRWNYS
jgi:hypothetical protein